MQCWKQHPSQQLTEVIASWSVGFGFLLAELPKILFIRCYRLARSSAIQMMDPRPLVEVVKAVERKQAGFAAVAARVLSFCALTPMLRTSLVAVFSILLSIFLAYSAFDSPTRISPQGCRMSWMSPSYVLQAGFNTTWTPLAKRYSLWLYREVGWEQAQQVCRIRRCVTCRSPN